MDQFLGKWFEGHGYEIKGTWKLQQLEYVLRRDLMVVPYSAGDKIPLDRWWTVEQRPVGIGTEMSASCLCWQRGK